MTHKKLAYPCHLTFFMQPPFL